MADAASKRGISSLTADCEVEAEGDLEDVAVVWQGATAPRAVTVDGVTTEAIVEGEHPQVIWLVDHEQRRCSNSIVVDDRDELEQILGDAERGRDRRAELREEDGHSQLVALLSWAHQRFIFDVDDTAALHEAPTRKSTKPKAKTAISGSVTHEKSFPTTPGVRPTDGSVQADHSAKSTSSYARSKRCSTPPRRIDAYALSEPTSETGNGDAGTRHPWSFSAQSGCAPATSSAAGLGLLLTRAIHGLHRRHPHEITKPCSTY